MHLIIFSCVYYCRGATPENRNSEFEYVEVEKRGLLLRRGEACGENSTHSQPNVSLE
jgi:hypothetical protein